MLKKTKPITFLVPEDILVKLDAIRANLGVSYSTALRLLLQQQEGKINIVTQHHTEVEPTSTLTKPKKKLQQVLDSWGSESEDEG